MRAFIVLKSVEKFETETNPSIFSVGGYTAKSEDGRQFSFDWDAMKGYTHFEDGYFVIKVDLMDFSPIFETKNLDNGVMVSEITPSFIGKSTLLRVTYECFMTEADQRSGNQIPLEVTAFLLVNEDISEVYILSEEQLISLKGVMSDPKWQS